MVTRESIQERKKNIKVFLRPLKHGIKVQQQPASKLSSSKRWAPLKNVVHRLRCEGLSSLIKANLSSGHEAVHQGWGWGWGVVVVVRWQGVVVRVESTH
ncbi:hypothetical protein CDAR_169781 [Caerostris darwini]|uniref:Uncharacterized protein n=1 Tax=Caerostris darwini TaxID=1538125 RepID=A0AAV4TNZ6_9ARAC|nr:hypothetical protein CDAR_169781 [Caerostris darwini]